MPIAVAVLTGYIVAQVRRSLPCPAHLPTFCSPHSPSHSHPQTPPPPTPPPHQIFFSVYEMAIDTILLSFCEDAEAHGGHPRFAPPLLMEAIGEPYPTQEPVTGISGVGAGGSGSGKQGRR
jgi:hypothetical protein